MNDLATNPDLRPEVNRRNLLSYLVGFSIVSTLASILTPIVGYLWPARVQATGVGSKVKAASLAELQLFQGLLVSVEDEPVVLTYNAQSGVRAFSAICTHLGCVCTWEESGQYIVCPCHDGRFNAQTGEVISGPPPSPLPPREVVVEGDDVLVVT